MTDLLIQSLPFLFLALLAVLAVYVDEAWITIDSAAIKKSRDSSAPESPGVPHSLGTPKGWGTDSPHKPSEPSEPNHATI